MSDKASNNDVSHVFINPDLEEGQDHYDELPVEYHDHLTKALLHMAGKGPHPGKYKGPAI